MRFILLVCCLFGGKIRNFVPAKGAPARRCRLSRGCLAAARRSASSLSLFYHTFFRFQHGREVLTQTDRRMWHQGPHRLSHRRRTTPPAPPGSVVGAGNKLRPHQRLQDPPQGEHRHWAAMPHLGGAWPRFLRGLPACVRFCETAQAWLILPAVSSSLWFCPWRCRRFCGFRRVSADSMPVRFWFRTYSGVVAQKVGEKFGGLANSA